MKLVAFALLLSAAALADAPPDVQIAGATYSGTGCPAGSASIAISPDKLALTILFDRFFAEGGPGVLNKEKRKDCAILVTLSYPQGWQYSVTTVDYRGYVALDDGAWARQDAQYKFLQGGPALHPSHVKMDGPLNQDYVGRDESGVFPRGYSKCGKQAGMKIDATVQVGGKASAKALVTVDSIDKTITQAYRLDWKKCR